jgi:hypothetical protein
LEIQDFHVGNLHDSTFFPNEDLGFSNFLPALRIRAISFDCDLKILTPKMSGFSRKCGFPNPRLLQQHDCNSPNINDSNAGLGIASLCRMSAKDEQQFRIEELRRRIREISGGACSFGATEECPPNIEEEFLRTVLEFETAEERSLFAALHQKGLVLSSPDELDEEQIHSKLWEVIHALADSGVSLHHTDHLSDRQLYEFLWCDALLERVKLGSDNVIFYHDIDGTESGEDEFQIYLKYYADDQERRRYAKDNPELEIPEHSDPPYDRDRLLP